jgi:hypothetical protein
MEHFFMFREPRTKIEQLKIVPTSYNIFEIHGEYSQKIKEQEKNILHEEIQRKEGEKHDEKLREIVHVIGKSFSDTHCRKYKDSYLFEVKPWKRQERY